MLKTRGGVAGKTASGRRGLRHWSSGTSSGTCPQQDIPSFCIPGIQIRRKEIENIFKIFF